MLFDLVYFERVETGTWNGWAQMKFKQSLHLAYSDEPERGAERAERIDGSMEMTENQHRKKSNRFSSFIPIWISCHSDRANGNEK